MKGFKQQAIQPIDIPFNECPSAEVPILTEAEGKKTLVNVKVKSLQSMGAYASGAISPMPQSWCSLQLGQQEQKIMRIQELHEDLRAWFRKGKQGGAGGGG